MYLIILENRKVKGYKLTGIDLLGFLGIQLNIKKHFYSELSLYIHGSTFLYPLINLKEVDPFNRNGLLKKTQLLVNCKIT
jgi:hypothetical protein